MFISHASRGANHSMVLIQNGEVLGLNICRQVGVKDKKIKFIYKPMKLSDYIDEKIIIIV